ncbi:MAG: hypothetical protein Q8O88_05265 [bacterium]|nr:hypothetical protein [bacterium]
MKKEREEVGTEISRRSFIRKSLILTGGVVFLANLPGCNLFLRDENIQQDTISQTLKTLKEFESGVGDRPLTFEQMQKYLPLVARLFISESHSKRKLQDILNNTYIVRRDFSDEEESKKEFISAFLGSPIIESSSVINQLQLDYPNLKLSEKTAKGIVIRMGLGAVAWVDAENDKIFIVLDRINNGDTSFKVKVSEDIQYDSPLWQFNGFGNVVACERPIPAVNIRSVYLHELVHYDAEREWRKLEGVFVHAYEQAYNSDRGSANKASFTSGQKSNFIIDISSGQQSEHIETGFDELVTEYLATKMSIKHGLSYTHGYHGKHTPYELANLEEILKQANITDDELFESHRLSKIEEFLEKVAKGAKNINFVSREQMLIFGIRRFLIWSSLPNLWGDLKKYYPGVDVNNYQYINPKDFKPSDPITHYNPEVGSFSMLLGCKQTENSK